MKRLTLTAGLAALLVGVVAMSGSAASFDDTTPCPADGPLLVCPKGQVGQPYSLQLRALAGCDIYRWEFTNGGLPPGLTMSSSGLITGTPSGSAKTTPWVTVHDLTASEGGNSWCGGDNHSERQFVFEIGPGLSIQNQSVPAGTIGQAYSQAFTALAITSTNPVQGSPATATWSIQSGSLPAGVTFTAAGLLSGTPTTEGSYTFVVRAVGGGGVSDTETETLVVRQPISPSSPFLGGASAPKAEVGTPFSAVQNATGGSGSFTWALASGSLPAGLEVGQDGSVAGTPLAPGRFRFALRITDTEGRVATINATLVVAQRLAIRTRKLTTAKVGAAYRAKLATLGGVAPTTWTVAGKLPQGVRFAARTGTLSGIPRKAGTYRLTFTALDSLGVRARKVLKLVVK